MALPTKVRESAIPNPILIGVQEAIEFQKIGVEKQKWPLIRPLF